MKKGFSLVELSVVLVIIGLLIGGVVVGNSLIKSSRNQAAVADFGKYKQAVLQFRDKYNYLPGDQPEATSTWTAASGNGDGNGRFYVSSAGSIGAAPSETFLTPQALALAGYISGTYTATGGAQAGVNLIKATADNPSGMTLSAPVFVFAYTDLGSLNKNVISISDITSSKQEGGVKAKAAQSIDQKMDDGVANTGVVRGFDNTTTCLTSGQYDVANNNTRKCIISYVIDN